MIFAKLFCKKRRSRHDNGVPRLSGTRRAGAHVGGFFMPVFFDRQSRAPAAVPADRRVDQGKTTADSSPVSCWLRTPPYPSVPQIVERSEPLTADRRVDQGNRPYRPHKPYGYWIVGAWSKTTADSSPVSCWLRTSPYSSVSLRTADCRAERAADRRLSPEQFDFPFFFAYLFEVLAANPMIFASTSLFRKKK